MKKFISLFVLIGLFGCAVKVYHMDKNSIPDYWLIEGIPEPSDTSGLQIWNEGTINIIYSTDTVKVDTTPEHEDGVSALAAPEGIRDYQIAGRPPKDSVMVMSWNRNPLSAKYGLGDWQNLRHLVDSLFDFTGMSDHDWYETGTTTPPNAITDDMFHEGLAAFGDDGPYDARVNIARAAPVDIGLKFYGYGDAPFINSEISASPLYNWTFNHDDVGSFYLGNIFNGDPQTKPFFIEGACSDFALSILQTFQLRFADYPNTRDDAGVPVNMLSTGISGIVESHPITDLPFMDNWLLAASGTGGTESITDNETVTITGAGINVATRSGSNVTVTGTEAQTFTVSDGTNSENLIDQICTFTGVGGIVVNYSTVANTVEIDGSNVGNQFLTNTSDATSHTVELTDGTGTPGLNGSLQLVEGSNITISTTGTGTDAIVTIASTAGGGGTMDNFNVAAQSGTPATIDDGETLTINGAGIASSSISGNTVTITATEVDGSTTNEIQTLDASGTSQPIALDLSGDATDPTLTGAGIAVVSASGNAITITATEVDGSTTNEIQTQDATGTSTVTWDLSGDATDISLTGAGIASVSRSGNAVTVTATEADGSTTNELQTLASTSGGTSHTVTLSNSGGSIQFNQGVGINFLNHTNGLNGVFEIEADDASETNEIQTLSASGSGTSYAADLSLSGGSVGFLEGTGITIDRTGNNLTFNASGGSSDSDWLEEGLGTPPNAINDHMYTGTGHHGFGTTTPDRLVHLSSTATGGPFLKMEYSTGTDANAVMGTEEFYYGGGPGALVTLIGQKQISTSTNDALFAVKMKDASGTSVTALELDQEVALVNDDPRLKLFGGVQAQSWINVTTTQTLDESFFGVRATTSGITLTLPAQTQTNNEHVGTILVIYNQSGADITIDPGSSSDTVNGSNANITLGTKTSRIFISTNVDVSGNSDWISFN